MMHICITQPCWRLNLLPRSGQIIINTINQISSWYKENRWTIQISKKTKTLLTFDVDNSNAGVHMRYKPCFAHVFLSVLLHCKFDRHNFHKQSKWRSITAGDNLHIRVIPFHVRTLVTAVFHRTTDIDGLSLFAFGYFRAAWCCCNKPIPCVSTDKMWKNNIIIFLKKITIDIP